MNEVAKDLQEFSRTVVGKPVTWGDDDCTSWIRKWVEKRLGRSLKAPKFNSHEEAKALIEKHGTLANVWSNVLQGEPLYPIDKPILDGTESLKSGDILVFDTQIFGQCGGIYTTFGIVAWRSTESIHFIQPRRVVKAWCLP